MTSTPGEFRVELVTPAQMMASRAQWDALLARSRQPVVFLSWSWIASWLESDPAGRQPRILFIRNASDELLGILPLARRRTRVGILPASVLTFCGVELYPDHLDLVCAQDADGQAMLAACFAFFGSMGERSAVLDLPFLAAEGFFARYLQGGTSGSYAIETITPVSSSYADLSEGYEAYLSRMSKKKRYNLTRERKILCEQHGALFERIDAPDSIAGGIDSLFELHAKRAVDKGLASNFAGADLNRFHRSLAAALSGTGQVRLYRLKVPQGPIATLYGFAMGREFSFYQIGFDPAWKKFSPGKVTISMALEQLAAEGVGLFDFLAGEDEYKQYWVSGRRQMLSFVGFDRSVAGYLSRLGYRALGYARRVRRRLMAPKGARTEPVAASTDN
jgi:CelD/BcsL family acetyltransferase involved in cellulose biosynthesis